MRRILAIAAVTAAVLTAGHLLYAAIVDHDYGSALVDSWLQVVAIAAVSWNIYHDAKAER